MNFLAGSAEGGNANLAFPATAISPIYLRPSFRLYKNRSRPGGIEIFQSPGNFPGQKLSTQKKVPAVIKVERGRVNQCHCRDYYTSLALVEFPFTVTVILSGLGQKAERQVVHLFLHSHE
jgi:hypothetical protein